MKCVYCHSNKAALDLELNQCVCRKCRKEFKPKPEREPESLNGFSLIIISILIQIPIISTLIVIFVCTGEVKYTYRKCIAYQFIAHIFIMFGLIYLMGIDIKLKQDYVLDTMVKQSSVLYKNNNNIEVTNTFTDSYYKSLIARDKEEVAEVEEVLITPDELVYLDGVIIDYNKAKDLIEVFTNSNYGMLLQTSATKDKYGKNAYYNICCLFQQNEIKESNVPVLFEYVNKDSVSLYYNGGREVVRIDNKDVFKSKYVYCLKSNELYKVKLLYDDNNVFVGAILAVVED